MNQLYRVLQNDERRPRSRDRENAVYFPDLPPNKTDEDALQYAMYAHLADSLAIKYVDSDIQKMIGEETGGHLDAEIAKAIVQKTLDHYHGITSDDIFHAIGEEFRIRTARKVLRGAVYSGRVSIPYSMTPFQLFEFYKDNCSEVTFEVVDVPVEPFIEQVKEEPTDRDLRLLFDKYRTVPYDPSRETPGFQEPRKVARRVRRR